MAYEAREIDEGDKGKRYLIIDQETTPILRTVTPNLKDNELTILMLSAKENCPIDETCVGVDDGVSSVCVLLENYPFQDDNGQYVFDRLYCKINDKELRNVSTLRAGNCPVKDKHNCIGCKSLIRVETVPYPSKSHCHVVCGAVKVEL